MKKIKKNAYTLTELIGVITLLFAVALIAIPTVEKAIKQGKDDALKSQNDMIILATQNYLSENTDIKINEGESKTINVGELRKGKFLDYNMTDVKTNERIDDTTTITITRNNGVLEFSIDIKTIEE